MSGFGSKTPRICEGCGKEFIPTTPTQKNCQECISKPCCVCGDKKFAMYKGKPYCQKHYGRMKRHESINIKEHPNWKTSRFIIQGDICYIISKNGDIGYADAEDYYKIRNYSWNINSSGYFSGCVNNKATRMHRLILGLTDPNICVDHINHNRLDNRKCNLRLCTKEGNARNMNSRAGEITGARGVYLNRHSSCNPYVAYIRTDGKFKNLGSYPTLEDAIAARKKGEEKYYGEFAYGAVEVPPPPPLMIPRTITKPIYVIDPNDSDDKSSI